MAHPGSPLGWQERIQPAGSGRNPSWTIYEAVKAGEIPAVKVGRLKRIPRAWVEQKLSAAA